MHAGRVYFGMRALKIGLLAAALAPAVLAAKPHPVRWDARASRVVAGSAVVTLRATIDRGWYVYGLRQPAGGPRPLRIRLAPGASAALGRIGAPAPKVEFDAGFRARVEKYTSTTQFTVPVRFTGNAPSSLRIEVLFQACNGSVCLPPRTQVVEARLTTAG